MPGDRSLAGDRQYSEISEGVLLEDVVALLSTQEAAFARLRSRREALEPE
jgi:hypothetical protein